MTVARLSSIQSEVFNLMSFVKSEETYRLMKQALSDFFAQEADKELNRLGMKALWMMLASKSFVTFTKELHIKWNVIILSWIPMHY